MTRTTMSKATWATMIIIVAYVWGGLFWAVRTAIRKESDKADLEGA